MASTFNKNSRNKWESCILACEIFTKNIATLKIDIVQIRATLKMSFAKNCAPLK